MNKFTFVFILLLLFLVSCTDDALVEETKGIQENKEGPKGPPPGELVKSSGPYVVDWSVSDFQPPVGASENANDVTKGEENPGGMRLLIATSDDALSWVKKNEAFIDQAGAPSALYVDQTIFLYYMTFEEGHEDEIVLAASKDEGKTWIYKRVYINITGRAADPTVVLTDDGTFRMYITTQLANEEYRSIRSAISTDGINFYMEDGIRVETVFGDSYPVASSIIHIDGVWHLHTLSRLGSSDHGSENAHLTSEDGLTFTEQDPIDLGFLFANGLASTEGYFYYGMQKSADSDTMMSIYVATTEDGYTYDNKGIILDVEESDLETYLLKEPAVVQLSDGTYIMFYNSVIPT